MLRSLRGGASPGSFVEKEFEMSWFFPAEVKVAAKSSLRCGTNALGSRAYTPPPRIRKRSVRRTLSEYWECQIRRPLPVKQGEEDVHHQQNAVIRPDACPGVDDERPEIADTVEEHHEI